MSHAQDNRARPVWLTAMGRLFLRCAAVADGDAGQSTGTVFSALET